jgi:hypothetical protein
VASRVVLRENEVVALVEAQRDGGGEAYVASRDLGAGGPRVAPSLRRREPDTNGKLSQEQLGREGNRCGGQ